VSTRLGDREVREMREAATVLGIIHARGRRGLPLEDIYRRLYNPHLYLRAYDRRRSNQGALTPRGDRGNRGRYVPGQDRRHHRRRAPGALPLDAGQADLHPEEGRETAPAGPAHLDG
jgi:hypothetical protein